jgi:hypothetical protein
MQSADGELVVAFVVAGFVSLYFTTSGLPPIEAMVGHFHWWTPIMPIFLGCICHGVGSTTVRRPLRAYLIAIAIAFILCWMGENNIRVSSDDDYDYDYDDTEPTPKWMFFWQFVMYVSAMLCGLYLGIRQSRSRA